MKKRKAAPPDQAGTWGKTAPTSANQDSKSRALRQCLKILIVRVCLWGFIPVGLAERLLRFGGLRHD